MKTVNICEVGPRDGLQNEEAVLDVQTKLQFILKLIDAGCSHIEAGAFVKASAIPQMANSLELFKELLPRIPQHVKLAALVPNLRGLEQAIECGVSHIGLLSACSEEFCQRNLNTDIKGSFRRIGEIVKNCPDSINTRLYLSMSFFCPWTGPVNNSLFHKTIRSAFDCGVDQIVLSDTTGHATPNFVEQRLAQSSEFGSIKDIACHFHNTYGMAVANVWQAWNCGVRNFDSSAGGLGGCPYAPGASGNVSTEELVYLFDKSGIISGIDRDKLSSASGSIKEQLRLK